MTRGFGNSIKKENTKKYERMLGFLIPLGWALAGGVVIASVVTSYFLYWASPLVTQGTGAILFIPLACGFIVGVVTSDRDFNVVVYTTLLMVIFSIPIILVVFMSPVIFGVALSFGYFPIWLMQRVILSFIITFPTTLVSAIVGKVVGERFSMDFLLEKRRLQRETIEWHKMLASMEKDLERIREQLPLEKR